MKSSLKLVIATGVAVLCCITSLSAQNSLKAYFQSGVVNIAENTSDFIHSSPPKNEMNGYYYRFIPHPSRARKVEILWIGVDGLYSE